MNSHLKINIIISLFIFSCTNDKIQIISNIPSDLPDQNYKINLKSNSGSFLANVTINWDEADGVVELYDSGTFINPSDSSHTFSGMNPGEFRDILINVITDDYTFVDSIQIFTRPIYPVSNFRYKVETVMRGNRIHENPKYHRILNWSPTIEPDESFSNYIIYRVNNNNADDLINPENCGCEIATLIKADTSFIDSTNSMVLDESGIYSYFYQIRVISGSYGRNSYIYNYTSFPSPSKVSLVDANVSKNNSDFIQVTWESDSNSTYFYQYEIWRKSDDNVDDSQRIAIILDPDQGKFMDRNVGDGTSYNYSVALVDINGRRVFSDYVTGWSLP